MTTSVSIASLQTGVQLGTTATSVVTCTTPNQVLIKRAVFTNATGVSVTLTVYRVQSGGAPGSTNIIIPARPVAANATDLAPELAGMVLMGGESIQALCSVAVSINAFASGLLVS